jgi:protein-S-isoprenylcysteine O-methyltransferase Ste14
VRFVYDNLITLMWLAFLVYWQIMWQITARGAKNTARLEPASSRALRAVLFAVAIVLFSWHTMPVRWLRIHLWPQSYTLYNVAIAMTAAGIAFAVWARVHLGTNWSRSVTVKQNHELITTGPYRLVRHPIYTGLLFGLLGAVAAEGQVQALIALALISWALWRKLRLEEAWMREQFGESYTDYSRRTATLVPFLL